MYEFSDVVSDVINDNEDWVSDVYGMTDDDWYEILTW